MKRRLARKIQDLEHKLYKVSSKFHYRQEFAKEAERTLRTLLSLIKSNDGIYKNPNILYYLKEQEYTPEQIAEFKEYDPDGHITRWNYERKETELERALKAHAKPSDIGCIVTEIPLNAAQFRSKWRVQEDAFIYDEDGVRIHFKVKNRYPEKKHTVDVKDYESGEIVSKPKVEVTKEFSALEIAWQRTPEIQQNIEKSRVNHDDWFQTHKDKVELILKQLPENEYNRRNLEDLRKKKKIDETKLEKMYDEAVAQSRPSFSGEGKNKTTIKITHVGQKESQGFRGMDLKSQIIGISDDFKQKIIVKFGIGTRAGQQLAAALNLPKESKQVNWVRIKTPTSISAHLPGFVGTVESYDESKIKITVREDFLKTWEDSLKEFNELKKGDIPLVDINFNTGDGMYDLKAKILERHGLTFVIENPIKESKIPYEDIHNHEDKMIGKKVTVEGEFRLWNDVIFVSKPKFTKA